MTREEIEHFIARLKLATVDEYNEIITALWLNDEQQREEIRRLREALEFIAGEASWLSEAEEVARKALTQEPT